MSCKWRNIKIWFAYSEGIDKPIVKPQFPMFFDLASDPGEEYNLFNAKMDMGWMFGIALKAVEAWQKSVAQYPNIEPGAEFKGYKQAKPPSQRRAPAEKSAAAGAR